MPEGAPQVVVFVHGSGSSRHSPRNRHVAGVLNDAGLGTLLFDLLTPGEERDRANVFDIGLLAGRLVQVTRWLGAQPTAAQAAIGGRPDLARPRLAAVTEPGSAARQSSRRPGGRAGRSRQPDRAASGPQRARHVA